MHDICHFFVFPGCSSTNDDKTCGKCRVAKKADVNQCLDECVPPNMISKDKECVGRLCSFPVWVQIRFY